VISDADVNAAVAGEIRAGLARQRATTAQLAQVAGVTPATVRRHLRGTSTLRTSFLVAAARLLKVSPASFFAGLPPPG
jgi:transcriptional regulator with XRE-family HTH domain